MAAAFLAATAMTGVAMAQNNVRDRAVRENDVRNSDVRQTLETQRPDPGKLSTMDKNFLEENAKRAMESARISRVAIERTSNPNVKRLAEMIVMETELLTADLGKVAMAHGLSMPAKDIKDDSWAGKSAASFDKDYLEKMVSEYNDSVKSFDNEARRGDHTETVLTARKHLNTLQKHLFAAIDLEKMLKQAN